MTTAGMRTDPIMRLDPIRYSDNAIWVTMASRSPIPVFAEWVIDGTRQIQLIIDTLVEIEEIETVL